jgi:hypothetical protein
VLFARLVAGAFVLTALAYGATWAWVTPDRERAQAAMTIESVTEGKALFDHYRRERAHLAEELQERSEYLSRREQRTITARVVLEMAAFLAILVLALQQHHALRHGIVAPVAALLRHIRRIRDGHMEATTDPAAPRDLAELAEGLNEIVRALAARERSRSRGTRRSGSIRRDCARSSTRAASSPRVSIWRMSSAPCERAPRRSAATTSSSCG